MIRKIIRLLIPAFFTIFFIREIFVREHWSFKVPAILLAIITVCALVQNILAFKYRAKGNTSEPLSLKKIIGLFVFSVIIILFPQVIFIESHWLFKIPVLLLIFYALLQFVHYLKDKRAA